MTAEVTVMNRQAVALAADSAVTVTTRHGRKAWQSATKIFPLAQPHAVGVMLYGGMSMHRLPWDTIIKEFRKTLPAQDYPRLEDYTTALLRFLRSQRRFYPPEEQQLYVYTKLVLEFLELRRFLVRAVESALASSSTASITPSQQRQIITEVLDVWRRSLDDASRLKRLPRDFRRRLLSSYRAQFRKAKADVFQQLPLTQGQSRKLTTLGQMFFERDWPIDSHSGLVIAGYGRLDLFPRFERLRIDGFALSRLIFACDAANAITRDDSGGVWAFAQGDDVYAFMEGILPSYQDKFERMLHDKIVDLPLQLLDRVTVTQRQKSQMRRDLSQFCHQVFADTQQELETYRRKVCTTCTRRRIRPAN